MSGVWFVLSLIGAGWVGVTVGFLGGAWWGTTAAVNRGVEESDHARYQRDERVRDAAEMALDGTDRP